MTPKELEAYDDSMTVMRDERGRIEGALEIGEKIGERRGEKRGVLPVALAMRKKNMATALIAELTGPWDQRSRDFIIKEELAFRKLLLYICHPKKQKLELRRPF